MNGIGLSDRQSCHNPSRQFDQVFPIAKAVAFAKRWEPCRRLWLGP
jgi:hypothetical protein